MYFDISSALAAAQGMKPANRWRSAVRSGASRVALCALLPLAGWTAPAAGAEVPALPTGGSFVAGQGTITTGPSSLTVEQISRTGVIDWQSFNIGRGAAVTFDNGSGATLNRVVGGDLTRILGSLTATGSVYVVNPQGVVVGSEGTVTVGGSFIASTLDVATAAFMAGGTLRFQGSSPGTITNLGRISATGGDVVLIARDVSNAGRIEAPTGTAALAAGSEVWLRDMEAPASVLVQGPGGDVTNSGTVEAARAELAAAGGNVFALAGDNGGIVRATGTERRNGRVVLSAGAAVTVAGTVSARNADGTGGNVVASGPDVTLAATGLVDVSGPAGGGTAVLQAGGGTLRQGGTVDARGAEGGSVHLLGDRVSVQSGALVDATGTGAGGTVLVGGDYLGGGDNDRRFAPTPLPNARRTAVEAGATLRADGGGGPGAGGAGSGGSVIVWADEATRAAGTISARGGDAGGDGGFVETSGRKYLDFRAAVDVGAPQGRAGTLLLDPETLTIRANDPDIDGNGSFGDDLTSPFDLDDPGDFGTADSIITSSAVAALLNAGTNLTLTANSNIFVMADITMSAAAVSTLSLYSRGNVVFGPGISIRATGASQLNMDFRAGGTWYSDGGPLPQGQITTDTGGVLQKRFESNGGSILMIGRGGNLVSDGVRLENTLVDAGGGTVFIQGSGGTTAAPNRGVILGWGTHVTTGGGGQILIEGVGGSGTANNHGIQIDAFGMGPGSRVVNTGWGGVDLVGIIGGGNSVGLWLAGAPGAGATVDGGAGPLTLLTDRLHVATTADGYAQPVRIAGSGALTISPVSPNRPLVVGGPRNTADLTNLLLDANLLASLQDGFTEIHVGRPDGTGAVTVNTAAFRDDVFIGNGGGTADLTVVGALTTGTASEAGHITLRAGRNIRINQGASIITQGRDITLNSNSDSAGSGWIEIGIGASTTTLLRTHGGDLVLGGGMDPRLQPAVGGGRNSHFDTGVALRPGTQLRTDGGDILIRGQGALASPFGQAHGIGVQGNVLIDSGSGMIGMWGAANPAFSNPSGADFGSGINFFDTGGLAPTLNSARVAGTAISITGTNSGTSGNFLWGVNLQAGTTLSALAGGDIVITGTGGGGTGAGSNGIQLNGNTTIQTTTGDIILTGMHGNAQASGIASIGNERVGVAGVTQGAVILTADRMALDNATIRTAGSVILRQSTPGVGINLGSTVGAGATLNLSASELNRVGAGLLTVGRSEGGSIVISSPVAPTLVSSLLLHTGGSITQSAALGVQNLSVVAGGNVVLGLANPIATLSGLAGGAFDFNGTGPLVIGTSFGLPGISAAGTVRVTAAGGALTLAPGAGVGASGTGDALVLAANGLFHNLSGAAALSVTGGGRWLVFSQTPEGATRGGLPGLPLYNRPFDFAGRSGGAISQTGNRFVHSIAPLLTVTANNASAVYGAPLPALTASITGLIGGDTLVAAVTGAPGMSGGGTDAGTYTLTPGLGTLTSDLGYGFVFQPGTLTITRAPLTVSANPATTIYGTTPTLGVSYSGFVAGDTAASALTGALIFTGAGTDAGTYSIMPGGLSAQNYDITFAPGTLTITRAPLTVTANSVSTVYGTAPALGVSYSGFVAGDMAASALTGAPVFTGAGTDAGTYSIMPGGLSAGNYDITFAPGTLTITRAPLTVTANSVSTVYGTAPALGVSYSGFVAGDTAVSALTGSLVLTGVGTNAGAYAITPGGLATINYDITYADGQLTITPRPVTFRIEPLAVSFGVPPGSPAVTLSTLLPGDQVAGRLVVTDADGRLVEPGAGLAPGTYNVRVAALQGPAAANYVLADSGHVSGTISVAPRPLPPVVAPPPQGPVAGAGGPASPPISIDLPSAPPQLAERTGAPAEEDQKKKDEEESRPEEPQASPPTAIPASPAPQPPLQTAAAPRAATGPSPAPASPASGPSAPEPQPQQTAALPAPGAAPAPPRPAVPGPLAAAAGSAAVDLTSPATAPTAAVLPMPPAPPGPDLAQSTGAAALALAGPNPTRAERAAAGAGVDALVGALLAAGADSGMAAVALQQIGAQQAAAQVRSGPATPAQAMGDALSRGGIAGVLPGLLGEGPRGIGEAQLGAALALGVDPAAALDRAAAAVEAAQAQREAAMVATGPGADRLAALSTGAGSSPADPAAQAGARALAQGLSADEAAAAALTAAETLARMQELATLPSTPETRAAVALAAGGIEGLLPLDAGGRPDPVAAAALSAALARGADMATALAEAVRAAGSAADSRRLSEVPVSERDRAAGGLAAGRVEDAAAACVAAGLCADPGSRERQLAAAGVEPDLLMPGLAAGQLPPALRALAGRENEAGALAVGAALLAGAGFDAALRQGAEVVEARNRMLAAAAVPGTPDTIYAVPQQLMELMAGTTDPLEVAVYADALVRALKRSDDAAAARAAGQAALQSLRRTLTAATASPSPAPPLTAGGP